MIVKTESGEELNLPTTGKLQEMAGIKSAFGKEEGRSLDEFVSSLPEITPRPPLAERVAAESEAFVKCVKYLRGELDMETDKAYDLALHILMIDRYYY